MEKVGIILLNYCNYNLTIDCIKSIRQSTYQNYEIIVVDNNSPDHSGENLSQLEGIRFLQMEENFGITDYSFINASPADSADAKIVSNQLLQVIRDVPKAVLQDYTTAIATQKGYLGQQQIFFSSIAVILLIISLFHIVNSMSHTILTRRREYGIIRAIGITDGGFYKMILQTGILYGLLADVFIYLIYNRVLRRVMNYYLAHVLQFLHYTTNIPNLVLNGIIDRKSVV